MGIASVPIGRFPANRVGEPPVGRPPRCSGKRNGPGYACDGRTHCSQMTSCAEATWFLQHCPGTKMDGDNDGVPCERQWCR